MGTVVILGIFVADTAYSATRLPKMGETILGQSFSLGPGGKGSNQAVAAAMAGAETHFVSRLGIDPFADMALAIWAKAGVRPAVTRHADSYTGAAFVFLEVKSGNNAIIVCPGVASEIVAFDVDAQSTLIEAADVFIAQLEQPIEAALRGMQIARAAGVCTILNPAPAAVLPGGMLGWCDYVCPNETEAEALTGLPVTSMDEAARAARSLRAQGAGSVVITLGDKGALFQDRVTTVHIPPFKVAPVVDTTGAGDAFNGAFAAALAEGMEPVAAARFGCAAAGVSVTRRGTAVAMPSRAEIEAALSAG